VTEKPSSTHAVRTDSPEATAALARRLGVLLRPGDWLALEGPLGAGKTTFAAGLARGLGYERAVRSPTFVLMALYDTEPPLLHADFYRLDSLAEAEALGMREIAEEQGAVLAVEWAYRFWTLLPRKHLEVRFEGTDSERAIRLVSHEGALDDRWPSVTLL
jgi:tRNA threonylcarbamoyladenosine biosynthesis protein TsaE